MCGRGGVGDGSMMVSVWKRGWWSWWYDGKGVEEGGGGAGIMMVSVWKRGWWSWYYDGKGVEEGGCWSW